MSIQQACGKDKHILQKKKNIGGRKESDITFYGRAYGKGTNTADSHHSFFWCDHFFFFFLQNLTLSQQWCVMTQTFITIVIRVHYHSRLQPEITQPQLELTQHSHQPTYVITLF
jgi:hypothetical protein